MIKFHIKKIFNSIENIFVLLLLVTIPLFCYKVGCNINIPNIGYVVNDDILNDEGIMNLVDSFNDNGYIKYESVNLLKDDITNNVIEAGIIIPNDFIEKVKSNDANNIFKFVSTDGSLFSDFRKTEILSSFMTIYAPYVTDSSIKSILRNNNIDGININKIKKAYNEMSQNSDIFTIDIKKVNGRKIFDEKKGEEYFITSLIMMTIIYILLFVILPSVNFAKIMRNRLDKKAIRKYIFVPSILLRSLILCFLISLTICIKLQI